jgi:hypothetical protein
VRRTVHRFVRETAYRFLPPFFFPPLAVFFAIVAYPPFRRGFIAAREPPALQRRGPRRAGLRCQSLVLAAVSIASSISGAIGKMSAAVEQKIGGVMDDTPGPVGG